MLEVCQLTEFNFPAAFSGSGVVSFMGSVVLQLGSFPILLSVQIVFFKGIALDVRSEVWPLLLGLVEYSDTAEVRKKRKEERSATFSQLTAKWYVKWH